MTTVCSIGGCEKVARKRGWCETHYSRWRRHGDPTSLPKPARKVCTVESCGQIAHSRGYCPKHAYKVDRYGSAYAGATQLQSPRDALENRVTHEGSCLIWTGSVRNDYGAISVDGVMQYVHRIAYELEFGPIPAGMFIDHICHNKKCVNVQHLRLATRTENRWNLNGALAGSGTGIRGVSPHGSGFRASVTKNKRRIYLGVFKTREEAANAVREKRRELFGEFAGRG